MSKKLTLDYIGNQEYKAENGRTVKREYGTTPNGNPMNGNWVYRNSQGKMIDFDQYRESLSFRNNLELK